jgi:hydrogenase maturation protein HypF
MTTTAGVHIEIRGTVQGVGFRPWVYRIAHELGVTGRVRNHARGVTIEAFGRAHALERLVMRLGEPPPPAFVRELVATSIPYEAVNDFVIEHSVEGGPRVLSIPPDLATCADCARELSDPADRRYRYAFTNCTACGPRFTIATGVPYDRPATTMAPFVMCPACQREYDDPLDRRFHAQPNACPVCGPRLALWSPQGAVIATGDPLREAAERLVRGEVVAVKGLGGFHLACDATGGATVATLRRRKHRDEKPFAVMVADVTAAHAVAVMAPDEAALLAAPERPIVLVPRRPGAALAREVAPETELVGLMLPYTPLHHLLLREVARPLVMTSANPSDEPICADNAEAVRRLGDIADALVVHDREIATRCDDSVARVIAGRPVVMRRSRGYVPRPIALVRAVARPVLAVGAQLKNACCIATGDSAYLGPHVGDLDNVAAFGFFESAIARLEQVLEVRPEVIAHDLHPGYPSTRYAEERCGREGSSAPRLIGVQHHHAHVVSAMAEHGLAGPVIGVAYDGTGWGSDGTSWGGEVLLARYDGFERLATFRPVALAGGDLAIREPWRIAVAMLDDAFGSEAVLTGLPLFEAVPARSIAVVRGMIRAGVNAPLARGVGRMFDGIGALGLGRSGTTYEGQLAVAWNVAADEDAHGVYPFDVDVDVDADEPSELPEIDLRPLVRAVVGELRSGVAPAIISARFHDTLIAATVQRVRAAVATYGRLPIVLTGGALQNPRLAEGIAHGLADLEVHVHGEVPPGDGGIALGQALAADAIAAR